MSNTNNTMQTQTSSALHNDTVSLCSVSKYQEIQRLQKKARLLKVSSMTGLKALQLNFKTLSDVLKDFCRVPSFKRTFSKDMDLLEKHLTKEILNEINCKTALTKLRTMFENAFISELRERLQKYIVFNAQSFKDTMIDSEVQSNTVKALNVDSVFMENTCSGKENSNYETVFNKSVNESSLDSETKDVHAIKYKMSKAKEKCITYFHSLHSHIQVPLKEDFKGTHIEHRFKRAFMSLFGQDDDTFTSTMFLNVDQLQKQLDKDKFQEDGSMAAFWVINRQFQKFIDSKFSLDYDSQMTDKYFVEYTRIKVKHFRDTLLQLMGNVEKFVAKRTRHQRQYDRRVNKRQMQMRE
ncbi:hypothetical protein Tco_1560139, partial [Tanacetum coccineum]